MPLRGDGRLNHDLMPGEKGPQDACGVFGVWAPGEEVLLTWSPDHSFVVPDQPEPATSVPA